MDRNISSISLQNTAHFALTKCNRKEARQSLSLSFLFTFLLEASCWLKPVTRRIPGNAGKFRTMMLANWKMTSRRLELLNVDVFGILHGGLLLNYQGILYTYVHK